MGNGELEMNLTKIATGILAFLMASGAAVREGGTSAVDEEEGRCQEETASVRGRLVEAAGTISRLMSEAEESDPELLARLQPTSTVAAYRKRTVPARFPRESHTRLYAEALPWMHAYASSFMHGGVERPAEKWPALSDAPALRVLLEDSDAAIRSLAAEALATLHQPEDLIRIAALLPDRDEGAPVLGWNLTYSSVISHGPVSERETDPVDIWRSWYPRTVRTCACRAIHLMTGIDFAARSFQEWWSRQGEPRHSLWYWQRRLERLSRSIEIPPFSWNPMKPLDLEEHCSRFSEWQAGMEDRRREVRATLLEELQALPAEVEAKVVLLSNRDCAEVDDVVKLPGLFFPNLPELRIESSRLLDLLDRKELWADVEWEGTDGKEFYSRLVGRIALSADHLFGVEKIPRLEALLDREKNGLWWQARAAIFIGISRLSPAVEPLNSDAAGTCDSVLRKAIREEDDLAVRAAAARELVRMGLSRNLGFLEELFFREEKKPGLPDVRQSIVFELGRLPLTAVKRRALIRFLTDRRTEPFWTRPPREMGDSLFRRYAIQSVNAHAGAEVLTGGHSRDLRNPERSAATLPEVLEIVRELDR